MSVFSFKSLFLDEHYCDVFFSLCVRKKLIVKSRYDEDLESIYNNYPLVGLKRLLINMVLFEHIDSYSTSLDLSGLIELGLINVDAFFNNGIMINDVYNKKAAEIMAAYKDDVIKYIRNSQYEKFYKRTLNSKKEISLFCMSPDQRILSLFDNFDEIVSNCDRLYVADAPFSFSEDNGINRILYCAIQNANVDIIIPSIKRYLAAGICLSEKNGTIFCSDIFKKPSLTKKTNIVDSIYYTVRAKLPDEINILPMPQTLDDVIELRKSPYIKSFRAVMSEWSHYIERGEFALASKVKNDAIRANRNLERLKKYKKFSTSPYTRVFNLLGGFVIGLSVALGITSFIEPYIIGSIEEKNSWILLTGK